jgi:hypothetical protein
MGQVRRSLVVVAAKIEAKAWKNAWNEDVLECLELGSLEHPEVASLDFEILRDTLSESNQVLSYLGIQLEDQKRTGSKILVAEVLVAVKWVWVEGWNNENGFEHGYYEVESFTLMGREWLDGILENVVP